MKRFVLAVFAAVLILGFTLFSPNGIIHDVAHAQTAAQYIELDKNGKPVTPRPSTFLMYSPTDLAHNGVTLPATTGATSNTNIVPMGGVTGITYFINCTQPAKVTINVYTADDIQTPQNLNAAPGRAYTLYASYDLVTAQTLLAGPQQVYIATELAPNITSGTLTTVVRLPQAAVSFSEAQTGATPGTCTGRLAVKYN